MGTFFGRIAKLNSPGIYAGENMFLLKLDFYPKQRCWAKAHFFHFCIPRASRSDPCGRNSGLVSWVFDINKSASSIKQSIPATLSTMFPSVSQILVPAPVGSYPPLLFSRYLRDNHGSPLLKTPGNGLRQLSLH